MRALVLYHPQSDHVGIVESYVHDFQRFKGKSIEKISLETQEGANIANLHDITQYPAVLVTGPEGHLEKFWQGIPLPLMDEVDSYLLSSTDYALSRSKNSHLGAQQPR